MRDLIKYFRSKLPEIYIKTLPIYIISVLCLSLGILYFPKGDYWIVCIGLMLFVVLILNKISKYITVKILYDSNIIGSNMRFNVDNYSIAKCLLGSLILVPLGEILYLASYTLIIPGIIVDTLFRTYFMQSIISGNSILVLLIKTNDFSVKVRLTDYSKGNIITMVVNNIYRILIIILFYMFTFKSYQELFSIGLYNTFITLVASFIIVTIIKIILQPYINYKDTLWAMMCVDPALGGIEVDPYGTIEDSSSQEIEYYTPSNYYSSSIDGNNYSSYDDNESYNNENYDSGVYTNYNNQYTINPYDQDPYNPMINNEDIIMGLDGNMYTYYPDYGYYENVNTGEIVYYDPDIFGNGG